MRELWALYGVVVPKHKWRYEGARENKDSQLQSIVKVDILVLSNSMLLMAKQHHVIHCAQFSNVSLIFSILARLNIRHYQRVLTLEPSLYPWTGKYTDPTRAMHAFKVLNGMVISLLSWHNVGRGRMGWREIGTVSTIMMTINVVVLCRSPYYFWARYLMPIIVLQFQKLFLLLTAIARWNVVHHLEVKAFQSSCIN